MRAIEEIGDGKHPNLELTNLQHEFNNFEKLIFSKKQKKVSGIYYIDRSEPRTVFQFNPVSGVTRVFYPSDSFPSGKKFKDILWANENYLLLGISSENKDRELHFIEIRKGLLVSLGSVNFDFDTIVTLGVLSQHQKVLLENSASTKILFWDIPAGKSCLFRVNERDDEEVEPFLRLFGEREPTHLFHFINENSIIIANKNRGKIVRFNIIDGEVQRVWEQARGTLKMSFHSDQILLVPEERADCFVSLSNETGEIIKITPFSSEIVASIDQIKRISDNHIMIINEAKEKSTVGIYNIRTEKFEHLHSSPDKISCFRIIKLSPVSTLILGDGALFCKTQGEGFSFQKIDMPLFFPLLTPLRDGLIFALRKYSKANIVERQFFDIPHDREGAILIKDKDFRDPIREHKEARTIAALCLARLVHEGSLNLDAITHILSFVCSGYESRPQLKKIGFFSGNLARAAVRVVFERESVKLLPG